MERFVIPVLARHDSIIPFDTFIRIPGTMPPIFVAIGLIRPVGIMAHHRSDLITIMGDISDSGRDAAGSGQANPVLAGPFLPLERGWSPAGLQ